MRFPVLCLLLLLSPAVSHAAPRIPHDRAEVLEVLPAQRVVLSAISGQQQDTQEDALADTLALLQRAQREGDPRYLGYAEAQLQRLPPTAEARLLRARLRQADHRFADAMVDLHRILQASPHHTEALLMQASIHQVQGEYALARSSCERITAIDMLMLALACRAQIDGLSGQGLMALQQLQKLTALDRHLTPDQRLWLHLATGDLAMRLNQHRLAGESYRKVMHDSPDALAAYADWLLAQARPADVISLLRNQTRHDGLLLRLAIAERQTGSPSAALRRQELQSRFAALTARGKHIHLREEAMFNLQVLGHAKSALALARQNWAQQREPADLLVYQQSAMALNSRKDLALIAQWLQHTRLQDVRLARRSAS